MKSHQTKIAESISLALNPFVILPVVLIIGFFGTEFPSVDLQKKWILVILLGNLILPLAWIYYLDAKGVVLDDTLANKALHRKRLVALLPILAILALEILVMLNRTIYQPIFAVFISTISIIIIAGLVSYFWKVSAHMVGFITTITLLTLLINKWVLVGLIFLPFLIWSRLKLHRHTPLQLITGVLLPPVIIYIIFNYFNLL